MSRPKPRVKLGAKIRKKRSQEECGLNQTESNIEGWVVAQSVSLLVLA